MRTKLICALLALCLFCSGCSVMDLDTQNLMSPPKATGDKADIQRVIEESAGSYTFKYPQKGDYRSAVIMHDINGDGTDEAVAFYKSNTPDGVSDITVIFIDQISGEFKLETNAIATARSTAGSSMRRPPTTFKYASRFEK